MSARKFRSLNLALGLIVLGVLVTGLVCSADEQQLPAYLQTAHYITSAKCKLCHKTQYGLWADTQHARNAAGFPWEQPASEGGQPLPAGQQATPEMIYRYVTGYNDADGTYAEKGTACEACHGPGSAHFMAHAEERKTVILNPANLTTTGQKASLCGRCHGQYSIGDKRYAAGFLPGMDLFKLDGFKLDPAAPGKPMDQLNELVTSKHFDKGVVCLTCHDAHQDTPVEHQLRKPVVELCTGCHQDKTMAAHAPTAAAGATCATCHMPQGQHSFVKPTPAA
jgi:predicted CXXCH cytochrome family protein